MTPNELHAAGPVPIDDRYGPIIEAARKQPVELLLVIVAIEFIIVWIVVSAQGVVVDPVRQLVLVNPEGAPLPSAVRHAPRPVERLLLCLRHGLRFTPPWMKIGEHGAPLSLRRSPRVAASYVS